MGASQECPRSCEARVVAERQDKLEGTKVYQLVSVRDMSRVHGWSEKKIQSIIARNTAVPDEDCPDIPEEARYWCLVEQKRTDTSTTTFHC